MKRRIVHYTNRGGRYGNQLAQFAHWIAYACEHPDTEIAFLPYWALADLSLGTEANPYCLYPFDPAHPPQPGPLLRASHALLSAARPERRRLSMWAFDHALTPTFGKRHERRLPAPTRRPLLHDSGPAGDVIANTPTIPPTVNLGDPAFPRAVEAIGRTVYVRGYAYRDWNLVEKHQQPIRAFLAPANRFQERARQFIAPLRTRYKTLVGVFVRQGDYRGWLAGEYFLSSERYAALMRDLRDRFGPDVGFIIASDEPQDATIFAGLPCAFAPGQATGSGHYLENVAALSMCDFIATVPSTSGVFPAFFGGVPIIPIYGQSADVRNVRILTNHLFDALRDPVMALSVN